MIPYHPYHFIYLGPLKLSTFGLLVSIGILAGLFYILKHRQKDISVATIIDLTVWLLIAGLVGARLGYVLANWSEFSPDPMEIVRFWHGGFGFLGGFLAGIFAGWLYIKKHRLNFWQLADLFTPGIVIGYLFGRFGCLIDGHHLGKPTSLPWAIELGGQGYQPTTIYSIIATVIILIILLLYQKADRQVGRLFTLFIILYSLFRFPIELLSQGPYLGGLTFSAWVSLLLLGFGLWRFFFQAFD